MSEENIKKKITFEGYYYISDESLMSNELKQKYDYKDGFIIEKNNNINFIKIENLCDFINSIPKKGIRYTNESQNIIIENDIIDNDNIILGNQNNITSNITLNSSIMAQNDIDIQGQVQNSQDSVIYSVEGNITIKASTISYTGLIYAPKGKVTLTGTNVNITGTIIAKEIEINADSVNFNILKFDTDTSQSLSRFQLFLANIFYDEKINTVDLIIMKKKNLGII